MCVCDADEEGFQVFGSGGGGRAHELIERSKVEQSVMLRKLQTAWRLLEPRRDLREQIYVIFLFLSAPHLCVFPSIKTNQCVLVVEFFVWFFMSVSGLGDVANSDNRWRTSHSPVQGFCMSEVIQLFTVQQ